MSRRFIFLATLACLSGMPTLAFDGARGPVLGAASNFGQWWQPEALDGGEALGITEFRDEVIWNHVEQPDGRLKFGSTRESYPSMLNSRGLGMILLGYSGHPTWEDGAMPQGPDGQAAFARYHARIVEMFPLIHSVEVGNEYNSWEFAENSGWPHDLGARARLYVDLLAVTAREVRKVNPDIRILGGAAHSIPLAWIDAVLRAGGGELMDAFVLHPYTTDPEQLARQIALARTLPGFETMPIEVTEFGTPDARQASGYLLRMYCQMAISGVTRAVWYPFSPRGDGLIPLVEADGSATDVGRTYALIREHLENLPVEAVSVDPFTYGCRFGDRALVLWGAPRAVDLADGLRALGPDGSPAPLQLSRMDPLLILSNGPAPRVGETVVLVPQRVRADSFDEYSYSDDGRGLSIFVRRQGEAIPLVARQGQDRDGVPWTPYLGTDVDGSILVDANGAVPSAWGPDDPLEIVYRYRTPTAETVDITIRAEPDAASEDGVTIAVERNGEVLVSRLLTAADTVTLTGIALAEGDTLDAVLGPNATPTRDFTRLRVTVEASE